MSMNTEQQARAALAYVKQQLQTASGCQSILQDEDFVSRLDMNFITLFGLFVELYGYRADCLDQIVDLIRMCGNSWTERPSDLKILDKQREVNKEWYMSNKMLGGVCYVDLYAGDLSGVKARIPYFKELGLTYLHLMPLFDAPEPLSDGGYAVSNYRKVKPSLGTIEELRLLASELREAGISLVLDMVFNHTSNEHEWARKAAAGDPEYSQYYWIFPDRTIPQEFEKTTREIFPDDHAGSFICLPDGRWVWSTFYHYQWDLNYSNPAVFRAMAGELLFLANVGIEFFRMDAVAFIWKQMGTPCESLPEAHKLLRAFNALCRIAAPSVLFKSEAIVHPDEVVQYIDPYECHISYNPLQMALTWEGLASRDASMLAQAIERRHNIANGCAWVNYVRSHDDIGWTFSDEDAKELGKDGAAHRRFLNAFFVNRHQGSFARGVPFQDNPRTGDCRISGTASSLVGLESGEEAAVERLLLAYSIAMSTGGIPLIYLGDEVGMTNDYSYAEDPARADDSRWVNRPKYPQKQYEARHDVSTVPGRVYAGIIKMIAARKATSQFAGGRATSFFTGNERVLAYQRIDATGCVLCLVNFSDYPEWVGRDRFKGCPEEAVDLVSGHKINLRREGIQLRSHQYLWLKL